MVEHLMRDAAEVDDLASWLRTRDLRELQQVVDQRFHAHCGRTNS
jgi:hypothetical protein